MMLAELSLIHSVCWRECVKGPSMILCAYDHLIDGK
jgi:hypothetical protein